MCLATVYKNPENTVVCKNVSRIDVDGEYVLIRDILGEEIRLRFKDPGVCESEQTEQANRDLE